MQALVTGGAGFIGSHVVDRLLAEGARVRVLDNLLAQAHPSGEPRNLAPEAELHQGDLRDPSAVARALEGIDTVFHLGGIVGNGQSMVEVRLYSDINVVGTAVLLEGVIAQRAQVRRLVVASSMVVYGDGAYTCPEHGRLATSPVRTRELMQSRDFEARCPLCAAVVSPVAIRESDRLAPTSVYGIGKRDQEELALTLGKAYGIPTVALRYLNTYGSRQALSNPYTGVCAIMAMRMLLEKRPVVFEDGGQLRDPIHVSDVARATVLAAHAGERAIGRAYNIGAGRPTTVAEMAKALAAAIGTTLTPEITYAFREGDIRHCFGDTAAASADLEFTAEVPFAAGARELVRWAEKEHLEDHTERANAELEAKGLLR